MRRSNNSCLSKRTGRPLSAYSSEFAAQESADYENSQRGCGLAPYLCDKCGQWHLSPQDRQTPSTKCDTCTGSDGMRKSLYESEAAASKRAEILYKEQGVVLKVYQCPYNDGWHLAKG